MAAEKGCGHIKRSAAGAAVLLVLVLSGAAAAVPQDAFLAAIGKLCSTAGLLINCCTSCFSRHLLPGCILPWQH